MPFIATASPAERKDMHSDSGLVSAWVLRHPCSVVDGDAPRQWN
jgi:hypothetical protein